MDSRFARTGPRRPRLAPLVAAAAALAAGVAAGCSASTYSIGAKPAVAPIQPGTLVSGGASASAGPTPATPPCDPTAISLRPTASDAGSPDVQKIKNRGKLIVGVSQDGYLTGYLNAAGQEEGFDIDIARQVEFALFGTSDDAHIQFTPVTLDQRITDLQAGTVDIVVDTMTITCARAQLVDFSTVYYEANQRLLVLKNQAGKPMYATLADLKPSQRVCVQLGSTSATSILSKPNHPQLYEVKDASDCLVALQQNEVDAVSTDDTLLAGLEVQDANTTVTGPAIESEPYGIAMSQSTPSLVRYVNGVLETIRANGAWTTIYDRWFGQSLHDAAPPPAQYAH
jgi:polar amino acid transport system substrate-binding protein